MALPEVDCEISQDPLPPGELWVPSLEERRAEEGWGPYRGTFPIGKPGLRNVREARRYEREAVAACAEVAADAAEFEILAKAIEWGDREPLETEWTEPSRLSPRFWDVMPSEDDVLPLWGLDLGVAGLVLTLSALNCFTSVSCRGHVGSHVWTDRPVVKFAAHRARASRVRELAAEANCGFALDGDPLLVWASSVVDMMNLADLLDTHRSEFVRVGPKQRRQRRVPPPTLPFPDGSA